MLAVLFQLPLAPTALTLSAPAVSARAAWPNVAGQLARGFDTTDMPYEYGLLTAEAGEALTAWRKGPLDRGEELADVFRYPTAIAEMLGVDLGEAAERKIAKNARHEYTARANGVLRLSTAPRLHPADRLSTVEAGGCLSPYRFHHRRRT
ncbi:hypothetical protein ACWDGI_40525 [Streptomyces sp. NPDC001220]